MPKAVWPEDWQVKWPERKCRDTVWNNHIAHSCDLGDLHEGPCASQSHTDSINRRHTWIKQQEEQQV